MTMLVTVSMPAAATSAPTSFGEAEVRDLHAALLVEQDALGLDAMDDASVWA
jgi:hypothetical protein